MLYVKNLHKSYQVGKNKYEVLKGIDFHVGKGEFVAGLNVETSTYDSVNMKANTVPESAKGLRMYHKLLLLNRKER